MDGGALETRPALLRMGTAQGRWTIAATVLGSGIVFIESTVVNVALPAMARDLGLGMAGVQWVLNGYFLSLGALMLLLSSPAGRLGVRIGPGWPVAGGALVAGTGILLLSGVGREASYVLGVLPGLSLFGGGPRGPG